MKKLTIILAAMIMLAVAGTEASARGFVVKGGMNFPNLKLSEIKSFDIKGYTGWHAGVGYQTGSAAGFSFQPELVFLRNNASITEGTTTENVKTNTLQLNPNVQWGVDLLICKPFLFVAPYAGLNLSVDGIKELKDSFKKLDWGVAAGAGINIWKLQLTGKYSWSFGNVADWSQYKESLKGIELNKGAFILSLGIVF